MRRERRRGTEFVEQQLLPVINIVFLLIPVMLVVIELTSFAALQASAPDAPQAAQAPASSVTKQPATTPAPPVQDRGPLFPDPMVGYGP